jgi:3-hydroxyacyl-[acyl-carrier-protein] dehydratase
MLKDSLYKIISLNNADSTIEAVLEIDKTNEIFDGHFPGQPVLPGACMLQMVKEILGYALNLDIRLKKAGQMKFMTMIDPTLNNIISLAITCNLDDNGAIGVTAKLIDKEVIYFKFQGVFVKI